MRDLDKVHSKNVVSPGEFGFLSDGVFYKGRDAEQKLADHVGECLVAFRRSVLGKDEDSIPQFDGTAPEGTHFSLMYEIPAANYLGLICTPGFLKRIFAGSSEDPIKTNLDIVPELLDVEFYPYKDNSAHHMIGAIAHITVPDMNDDMWKNISEHLFLEPDVQGRLMAGYVSGVVVAGQTLDLSPRGFEPV